MKTTDTKEGHKKKRIFGGGERTKVFWNFFLLFFLLLSKKKERLSWKISGNAARWFQTASSWSTKRRKTQYRRTPIYICTYIQYIVQLSYNSGDSLEKNSFWWFLAKFNEVFSNANIPTNIADLSDASEVSLRCFNVKTVSLQSHLFMSDHYLTIEGQIPGCYLVDSSPILVGIEEPWNSFFYGVRESTTTRSLKPPPLRDNISTFWARKFFDVCDTFFVVVGHHHHRRHSEAKWARQRQ